jgi:transaldolase
MPIFLDTSDLAKIKRYHEMGIVRGVTTNPTILLKEGIVGETFESHIKAIAKLIAPYPFSVEVMSENPEEVFNQAKAFASWAENINIKITIHGANGELDNLKIAHELEHIHNIRVNVTAMMSAQQAFLAALSGATYVSIFGGRVNNMGYNACSEISRLRKLIDQFQLKSQIIVGSTREVLNVTEWLEAGAHIVTVLPNLLETMLVHPYSKETIKMFLDDAAKTKIEV